ncbi:ABC transporter ATP-binding protein [Bremerella sp. JC817]|uniref:ABC transporter ATP-binding protein n=1 Tax=Bremerella sp. JC817 TaxID=3231756 RepID=UPI00345B30D4
MILTAKRLSFHYGAMRVLHEVDLTIEPGITAIVGPNAAGKSTLMKCLGGILKGDGKICLDGEDIAQWPTMQTAQRIGYLPQDFAPQALLSVFETILLGRLNTLGWQVSDDDIARVEAMLSEMQLEELGQRRLDQLSGGQAQLVAIAQALVREPEVLLLDEPTSNLDLRRQFEVLSFVRDWTKRKEAASVVAIHDLNLAARFADRIVVMSDGRIHSHGVPATVLTRETIAAVYSVEAHIVVEDGETYIHVTGTLPAP